MSLAFRPLMESDAPLLLKWRTDPDIAKHMFTDLHNTTLEQQIDWINSLSDRKDYKAFIILDDTDPIGFLSFAEIDLVSRRCSPGFYIYNKAAGIKYAVTLYYYISHYAFRCLNCNKIVSQVLDTNEKVHKLQKVQNMTFVGCLRQHVFKNNAFHDVYVYEVLKQDWELQRPVFSVEHLQAAFLESEKQ